jgi:quaternary ammonium compound-resistance protein SugE
MAWTCLLIAGLLEVGWATGLKYTEGLTRPGASVATIITSILSFVLLAWAMKTLPLGTSYAVWTGIGVIGTAILGMVLFGDSANPVRLTCIGMILVGIVGLRLTI